MKNTERRIGLLFAVSAASSLALAVVYVFGGQPQLEGLLLGLALAGIGIGLVAWAKHLFAPEESVEDRASLPSASQVEASVTAAERGGEPFRRRGFLSALLASAIGALGLAALFPIRSLGPRPGNSLAKTPWRRGIRVVTADGSPVRPADLQVGGVLTVFPEGHLDAEDAQTLLIRVRANQLKSNANTPDGFIAYSKICTHAGCPVGLYAQQTNELYCPCHQSVFDVLDSARPTSGPAARPLPQLPLDIVDGYIVAAGDFPEPVGPSYWRRG